MKQYVINSVAISNAGNVRENNEDNLFLNGVTLDTAIMGDRAESGLFAVCDGMGGEAYGEVASAIAVDTLNEIHQQTLEQGKCFAEVIDLYAEEANARICAEINRNDGRRMGTTFAILCVEDNVAHIYNIGDSRVYLFRNNQLKQITQDHTRIRRLLEMGILTEDKARTHPERHMLTQHLGIFPEEMIIETFSAEPIDIMNGDTFLLCSDGLTDMVDDKDIEVVFNQLEKPVDIAKILVKMALEKGGKDNVTVIVSKVEDAQFLEQQPPKKLSLLEKYKNSEMNIGSTIKTSIYLFVFLIVSILVILFFFVMYVVIYVVFNPIPQVIITEISQIENVDDYTKEDVLRAIDQNQNLSEYREIMIDFVNDVYRVRPEHNWWVFYHNVSRMNFETFSEGDHIYLGVFYPDTSYIKYLETLDGCDKTTMIRHELVHALYIIYIEINEVVIVRRFSDHSTNFGTGVEEAITSLFNYYSGNVKDTRFYRERLFLQPIFDNHAEHDLFNILFEYNIDAFTDLVSKDSDNLEAIILYLDTLATNRRIELDGEFIESAYEEFIRLHFEQRETQLNKGIIDYATYRDYTNRLFRAISSHLRGSHPEYFENIRQTFIYYEKDFLTNDTIREQRIIYGNKGWFFTVNENFEIIGIRVVVEPFSILPIELLSSDLLDQFYFLIEQIEVRDLQTRLVERNNPYKIDLLSQQPISRDAYIIGELAVLEFVMSIQEALMDNKIWQNEDSTIEVLAGDDTFSPEAIMGFIVGSDAATRYRGRKDNTRDNASEPTEGVEIVQSIIFEYRNQVVYVPIRIPIEYVDIWKETLFDVYGLNKFAEDVML